MVLSADSPTPLVSAYARLGLAIIAVLRGDVVAARDQYANLRVLGGCFIKYTSVDRILGLLALTTGELDQASSHFDASLNLCRKAGSRPELAWTCHDYADTLHQRRGAGDFEKAKSLLDESQSVSTELGMRPLMERAKTLSRDGLGLIEGRCCGGQGSIC